jgi:hypothetical protein
VLFLYLIYVISKKCTVSHVHLHPYPFLLNEPGIMPLFHCERDGLLREGLLYTEACLRQILQRLNILFGEDRDLH